MYTAIVIVHVIVEWRGAAARFVTVCENFSFASGRPTNIRDSAEFVSIGGSN